MMMMMTSNKNKKLNSKMNPTGQSGSFIVSWIHLSFKPVGDAVIEALHL